MSLEIMTIASSSKGNCILIKNNNTNLLIDMGISMLALKKALSKINLHILDINGILITHEHHDHISGIQSVINKTDIPIYSHSLTLDKLEDRFKKSFNRVDVDEKGFDINGIDIKPFNIMHDAVNPFGYSCIHKNNKISVSTDLGIVTKEVLTSIKGSDIVLVESNHDIDMLRNGKYPQYIKKRILGNNGHLSNYMAAELCKFLVENGTDKIILGHLSQNNNTKRLAYSTTANFLENSNITVGKDVILDIAAPKLHYLNYSTSKIEQLMFDI